ncbi:uncharacterized protein L203_101459 [Cryptococcus depauperatus CBS 7841]|uniref:PHD-type domain-containing protein n=1 Tax=Cryptococcus depauperatus CBS 7841 TaxID=1295531 RepID=A0AAJ8M075_9TREE
MSPVAGEFGRERPSLMGQPTESIHVSINLKKRKYSDGPRLTTQRKGKTPAGSLSILAPPPADHLPEALQHGMPSKTASPAPTSELVMASDADSIRREAAAGYESRLRARQPGNVKKENGQRTGVSASGRDVRIGGSARQTAQPKKDTKGKGKSEAVQPNQDFCSACRGIGRFLCCDGCPRSFHFMCLEPPLRLDELPSEEMWLCKECRAEKAIEERGTPPRDKAIPAIPAVFRALCKKIDEENPEQFKLPTDVRKFFAGVTTGANGEYLDAREARLKIDRKGFLEDRDPFRLRDGRQKKIECFHCGGTALPKHTTIADPAATWRQIVSCDYCPLSFHLDCLNPPLTIMPSAGRKWMCPNHPDHVMPRRRTLAENLTIMDVDSRGQWNNGNIVIAPVSEGSAESEVDFDDMIINRKRYRVPEKVIRLDFWDKLRKVKALRNSIHAKLEESEQREQSESHVNSDMEELNAAAMMMALAFSRHTPAMSSVQAPFKAETCSQDRIDKQVKIDGI